MQSAKTISDVYNDISPGGMVLAQTSPYFDQIAYQTQGNSALSQAWAREQMDYQTLSNQNAMTFEAIEAAKNRSWQEWMSNTAHQREVADLKAAGLNPVLSATGGNGAAVTSGAMASGHSSEGARGNVDQGLSSAYVGVLNSLLNAEVQMRNNDNSAFTNMMIADKQIEAQKRGQDLSLKGTKYSADQHAISAKNIEEMREAYDELHPNNAWNAIGTIVDKLFGLSDKDPNSSKSNDSGSIFDKPMPDVVKYGLFGRYNMPFGHK